MFVVIVLESVDTGQYYRRLYYRGKQTLDVVRSGQAFSSKNLAGHFDRVMAVYYRNGMLASGSDDHCVRIWNASTGDCVRTLRTHTVADVKFDDTQVLTASFDTTAACWDMDGNIKQHFQVKLTLCDFVPCSALSAHRPS